jgi:hypothetical protein
LAGPNEKRGFAPRIACIPRRSPSPKRGGRWGMLRGAKRLKSRRGTAGGVTARLARHLHCPAGSKRADTSAQRGQAARHRAWRELSDDLCRAQRLKRCRKRQRPRRLKARAPEQFVEPVRHSREAGMASALAISTGDRAACRDCRHRRPDIRHALACRRACVAGLLGAASTIALAISQQECSCAAATSDGDRRSPPEAHQ